MYDGIILHISAGVHSENSLKNYVDDLRAEKLADPVLLEVSEITPATIAGLNGFQFTEVGLGELTNIYLPINEGEYLHFGYLLADPENLGYQNTLDLMLSTLSLN